MITGDSVLCLFPALDPFFSMSPVTNSFALLCVELLLPFIRSLAAAAAGLATTKPRSLSSIFFVRFVSKLFSLCICFFYLRVNVSMCSFLACVSATGSSFEGEAIVNVFMRWPPPTGFVIVVLRLFLLLPSSIAWSIWPFIIVEQRFLKRFIDISIYSSRVYWLSLTAPVSSSPSDCFWLSDS